MMCFLSPLIGSQRDIKESGIHRHFFHRAAGIHTRGRIVLCNSGWQSERSHCLEKVRRRVRLSVGFARLLYCWQPDVPAEPGILISHG